jgi:hypothetical protein
MAAGFDGRFSTHARQARFRSFREAAIDDGCDPRTEIEAVEHDVHCQKQYDRMNQTVGICTRSLVRSKRYDDQRSISTFAPSACGEFPP